MASVWLRKSAGLVAAEVFAPAGVSIDAGSFDVSFGYPIQMQKVAYRKGVPRFVGGVTMGTTSICIPPQPDPLQVLAVLVHEMIHVILPDEGHKGAFRQIADAVGLRSPYPSTTAGAELIEKLKAIVTKLGPMPLPFNALPPISAYRKNSDDSFSPTSIPDAWAPPRKK